MFISLPCNHEFIDYCKIGYLLLNDTLFGFLLNLSNFSREALVILILFFVFQWSNHCIFKKRVVGA